MATAQKLTDHFLTCTVCHEIFTDPSTLSCGHSFCGQCIVTFTKTRPDAVGAKSIPCPFCWRLTRVPDPTRPVEEWAGQMNPTLLLKGLLDTIGPGAPDTTNCNLCHDEGETTPAVAWCPVCDVSLCTACLKAHRRIPATRHHDVSDMSEEVKVKRKEKVTCHEHKDEFVKFYCKDCKKTLCQSCCILYHRKCESVVSLESMLPEMRTSLEERKEKLTKKHKEEERKVDSLKSECSDLEKTKSSIQSQIRSTAHKAIDAIKRKEKKLTDELNEITDKQMDQLKADIMTGDMAIQIYRQQCEFIDQALNSDSEMGVYDLYQSCESEVVESVEDRMNRRTRIKVEFSQDMKELEESLTDLPLGKIQAIEDRVLDTVSTPVLSYTTDCRTKEDRTLPYISDIKCVEVNGSDHLIVADAHNNCIKSFYKIDGQQNYSRLNLQSIPRRIAKLVNTIAVTLSYSKQIVIVSVTPDLALISTITTNNTYLGLTALTPTTLAAGSQSPPCVDILDMSGNVLQSISPLHNGEKIIHYPDFLCTTKQGNILVSDNGTKSIVCLTPQGEVVFNCSPTGDRALCYLTGIISTATGHILVVDNWGHRVIQLSESGQFVGDILTLQDGIRYPRGIDYSERGRIYVTHSKSNDCDSVQMFTLK